MLTLRVGNLSALDSTGHSEDEDTILRASLLQRQLPNLPIRLLLLRSWAGRRTSQGRRFRA